MTRKLGLVILLLVCVGVFAVAGCGGDEVVTSTEPSGSSETSTTMAQGDPVGFIAEELIGTPTNDSVVINVIPESDIQYKYEYGTSSGSYESESAIVNATGGDPSEITISGLTANTLYYYRMVYDGDGDIDDGDSVTRTEHSFRTGRAQGDGFVFTVTADIHDDENSTLWANVLNSEPDLHIDLGDTFIDTVDESQNKSTVDGSYLEYRDSSLMGMIGSSVPIYLVPGNWEEEEGWNLDDTPFSIGVASIQARKAFYPTPNQNDGFYSVNTDPLSYIDADTYGDQMREDYYAWTWGDALFVVIDVFQYTMEKPYDVGPGEGSDDEIIGDQWSWTLGETQYDWLKDVLRGSDAKYKFVFCHQPTGGIPEDGYVRGGAEAAGYFEWGGHNADGTWGFDTERPGWEMPIHDLLVETGVSACFHGHDHQYVYEIRDGVVYQECSSGGIKKFGFWYTVGTHTDDTGTYETIHQVTTNAHSYLTVTIDSDRATVDYINESGAVEYSYAIDSNEVTD